MKDAPAPAGDPRPPGRGRDQRLRPRRRPRDRAGLPPPRSPWTSRAARSASPRSRSACCPGGGGVVRTVRMFGIQTALMNHLLQGQRRKPKDALAAGLVDELVNTPEELMHAAKTWALSNLDAVQPWDVKGYKIPGGTPTTPAFAANLPGVPGEPAQAAQGRADAGPAPHHGRGRRGCPGRLRHRRADRDAVLRLPGHRPGQQEHDPGVLLRPCSTSARAATGPRTYPTYTAKKVVVLGAGMMGAGIAYVCARSGMEVVLKDMTLAAAEKGKAYSKGILDKAVARGKMTGEQRDEVLARITPTENMLDAKGADLMIEAVFEDPNLKKSVYAEVVPLLAPDALLGSNTSTLPVTGLAEGVDRPEDFIGLHFFSPVDKMQLLEIVVGEKTSDAALAKAIDVALQIRKTADRGQRQPGLLHQPGDRDGRRRGCRAGRRGRAGQQRRAGGAAGRLPGRPARAHRRGEPHAGPEDQARRRRRRPQAEGTPLRGAPRLRGHREDGHRARARRTGRRRGLLRLRRGQEARPVERAEGLLRRRQPGHPVQGPPGAHAVHRGDREHQVPRRERAALRAGCQHRLDLRHRLPGLDRWRAAVRQRLRRAALPASWPGPTELAETYGERFTPPASVVAMAEAGGVYR